MKTTWYHSLLLFVIIVLYLVIIALWISVPEELTLNISATIFNVILTLVYLILKRNQFKIFYASPQFRRLVNTLISASLIFCILGLLNYLVFKKPMSLDLSENEMNSLTDQSYKILDQVKKPLAITLFSTTAERDSYMGLLELYRLANPKIKLDFVDAETRPDLVSQFGIQKSGTIVLRYGEKSEKVLNARELDLTNALIRLTRKEDPLIVFTKGHGEADLNRNEGDGLSHLKSILVNSSYTIEEVNLLQSSSIPKKAILAVIWGPRRDFSEQEIKTLNQFWENGGNFIIALNPDLNKDPVKHLRSAIRSWGIDIKNNLVIDLVKHVSGSKGSVPLIDKVHSNHQILKGFEGSLFFPLVSSVHAVNSNQEGYKFESLIETSVFPGSWGENNPMEFAKEKVVFNPGEDVQGPVTLVGAAQFSDKLNHRTNKIMAFGNATFINNSYARFSSNFTFIHNAIAWQSNNDQLISFNLSAIDDEPVFISSQQLGVIFYFSVLFAPLLLLGFAVVIYRRRLRL